MSIRASSLDRHFVLGAGLSLLLASGGCSSPQGYPEEAVDAAADGHFDGAGGGTDADADVGVTESGTPDSMLDAATHDHGAPSTTYPAFPPDQPTMQFGGGRVLTSAELVTVTYPGDAHVAAVETFADQLGASSYWKTTVSEYGVGPTKSTAADHVRMTTPPPSKMTQKELEDYIAKTASDPKSGWPAATEQTLYVLYLPAGTSLTVEGDSADLCYLNHAGYHWSALVGSIEVAYAVVLDCGKSINPVQTVSGLIAAAATSPLPTAGSLGYAGADPDHFVWTFMLADQDAADFCYRQTITDVLATGFGDKLARLWSNASAKAGRDPCLPTPSGQAYFDVTPPGLDKVVVLGHTTKGIHLAVGETRIVELDIWSDAATKPLDLSVNDVLGDLDVSLDRASGQNGEKVYLTVSSRKTDAHFASYLEVGIATAGTLRRHPIMVGR